MENGTLPTCPVLNIDVGDNVAPSRSVFRHPGDLCDAPAASYRLHAIHKFYSLPPSCSFSFDRAEKKVFSQTPTSQNVAEVTELSLVSLYIFKVLFSVSVNHQS